MADFRHYCVLLLFTMCCVVNVSNTLDLLNREEDLCKGKMEGCYCTKHILDCVNANLTDISDIYPFMTENVTYISIVGSSLSFIPGDLFGRKLDKLRRLNLTMNHIEKLEPSSFENMKHLKSLDMSFNDIDLFWCDAFTKNPFSVLGHLEILRLRDSFHTENDVSSCDLGCLLSDVNVTSLKTLDISSNGFTNSGKKFETLMCKADALRSLNLSENNLERLPVNECMLNLLHLDLSKNKIKQLTRLEMNDLEILLNMEDIKLGGNPFQCDCWATMDDTFDWLNTTDLPLDFDQMTCHSCEGYADQIDCEGTAILKVNLTSCAEPRISICYGPIDVHVAKSTLYVVVAASIIVTVSVICAIVLIRRHRSRRRQGDNREDTQSDSKTPVYTRMV